MLFNSFLFLLVFLPSALSLHWLVERFQPGWRLHLLVFLSFVFYGYWDWRFIPLLALSILINWTLAEFFARNRQGFLIAVAIAVNLLVLGYFKYANFFSTLLPGVSLPNADIFGMGTALPLGISFFTFHHVMYLSDLKAGKAPRYDLTRYALYIGFFPQVLSGPLVRWSEIMHQFEERPYERSDAAQRFAWGMMLVVIGLAKKVFLGDPLAADVNPIFAAAANGEIVSLVDAWQATLGFTFQIYCDFSGYTDMAVGVALMFGIVLPQNFRIPYRATSLSDFWRRWHMTLSRFLRDYLYIPLGGNRRGLPMQLLALLATMVLGGLWHGAGLTFAAWGALHGFGLCVGVLWRRVARPMPAFLGWGLTFAFVVLAWVLFRAPTFHAALRIYDGLIGFAPVGHGLKWRSIAVAAAVAMIGPTTWDAVRKATPSRWAAVAFAILFVLTLFKMGNDETYEFIYFQF
ncbi:MBOAT family protein [Methylocapsa sp. S129]|uniref:MBOAT family O-acyltransferase n=1 Tax=Methylocapsa sp. S129 TaxID=1641869 RepID=UPI00131C75DF|nr:MBOAT family O-acyltransferase [Methylocapsa sp. S129]